MVADLGIFKPKINLRTPQKPPRNVSPRHPLSPATDPTVPKTSKREAS